MMHRKIALYLDSLLGNSKKRLVRIELTLVAWKATVLPLNYRRMKEK